MEIAAILLAAGRSRRMSAFKPLLPFGEQTVIETCLANLRGAGIDEIMVVLGHRGDELQAYLRASDVSFAVNPDPDSQMSASIACGLEQVSIEAKAFVIALVDHPAVESAIIELIIDEWRRGARMIQPDYQGRGGHPVLIDAGYRDELLHLDAPDGLRSFFEKHRAEVRRLPVASPFVARDMDKWEDYVRLHQDVFGRPPKVDLA